MKSIPVIKFKDFDNILKAFFETYQNSFQAITDKVTTLNSKGRELNEWLKKTKENIVDDKNILLENFRNVSFDMPKKSDDFLVLLDEVEKVINDAFKDILQQEDFFIAFFTAMQEVTKYRQDLYLLQGHNDLVVREPIKSAKDIIIIDSDTLPLTEEEKEIEGAINSFKNNLILQQMTTKAFNSLKVNS